MAFCEPVDPTCSAVDSDRPLGADGAAVRSALGALIVDFLGAAGVAGSRLAPEERTAALAPPLIFAADAVRVPDDARCVGAEVAAAGAATAAQPAGQAAAAADEVAWEALRGALDGWMDRLRSELRLAPSSFAEESAEWAAGGDLR